MTSKGEHEERQKRVLAAIGQGVMILPSAPLAIRNNDVEHEYRQDSDLFYLTGFDEPESVLVVRGGHAEPIVMFVRPRDPEREVWDGQRAGVEGAIRDFGANVAWFREHYPQVATFDGVAVFDVRPARQRYLARR